MNQATTILTCSAYRPAAEQRKEVQRAFLHAPGVAHRGRLVVPVGQESHHARHRIKPEHRQRQPPEPDHRCQEGDEPRREHQEKGAAPRRGRRRRALADEGDRLRLPPPLGVGGQLVADQFVTLRPALAVSEAADVQKDQLATAVGRSEAESFVVVPSGDLSLVSHAGWE